MQIWEEYSECDDEFVLEANFMLEFLIFYRFENVFKDQFGNGDVFNKFKLEQIELIKNVNFIFRNVPI